MGNSAYGDLSSVDNELIDVNFSSAVHKGYFAHAQSVGPLYDCNKSH